MNSQHKFLYISFFFPPSGGAESRRNLSVIKRLYYKGFLPTIITAPEDCLYPKDEYLKSVVQKDIEIRRCSWPYKYEGHIREARRLIRLPENQLVFKGRKYLYKVAQDGIDKEKYEFIYSVHGIGVAHLAALKLKRKTGIPWIAEFQDPWIHNVIIWDYMRDNSWNWWYSYQFRKTKKLLNKVLKNADLIIVESPMHGEFLVRDFKVDEEKVLPLEIGYGDDYFKDIKQVPIKFTKRPVIGFVGTAFYGYEYAVENFVKALKELEKEGLEFTLVSVGDNRSVFSKYAKKVNLKNFLAICRVNLDSALSLMKMMDFGVVVISKEYEANINSKLWEYLNSGLSILALVPENGAMAKIIKECNGGYILPYDAESTFPILKKALNDYKESKARRADYDFVKNFSCEKMVDELIQKIQKMGLGKRL